MIAIFCSSWQKKKKEVPLKTGGLSCKSRYVRTIEKYRYDNVEQNLISDPVYIPSRALGDPYKVHSNLSISPSRIHNYFCQNLKKNLF